MNRKARFGVSLDANLAEEVDKIVKATDTNRSQIVSLAVQEFITQRFHFLTPHPCEGIMIITYEPPVSDKIDNTLEQKKDTILSRLHLHSSEGYCVEVLYVKAPSEQVLNLESNIQKCGCKTCRFIPCHT